MIVLFTNGSLSHTKLALELFNLFSYFSSNRDISHTYFFIGNAIFLKNEELN